MTPGERKKRAISDSAKEIRRNTILEAAETLILKDDFKNITITRIAEESNLAHGTVFLYFKSKEELFLDLTIQNLERWFCATTERLNKLCLSKKSKSEQISIIIEILVSSFDNSSLLRLLPILDDTLEHNITTDKAFSFKSFLKQNMESMGTNIERVFSIPDDFNGAQILHHLFICLIGTYKVSHPSTTVKKVIQNSSLQMFDIDFKVTLKTIITNYLKGILLTANRE